MRKLKNQPYFNGLFWIGLLIFNIKNIYEHLIGGLFGYRGGADYLEFTAGLGAGMMIAGVVLILFGESKIKNFKRALLRSKGGTGYEDPNTGTPEAK